MIVVDASALLEVLLNTPDAARIPGILFATGESLHAPHLLDLEVAQVLRLHAASGQLGEGRSEEALEDFTELPVSRYPHMPFLGRIWELRHHFTAYDAAHLALAETLDAPPVTRDRALAQPARHRAAVTLV